jgi:probable rRNA maturation factor
MALSALGYLDAELSITLCDDATIADLAGRYGRPHRATDVLAFPLAEGVSGDHSGTMLGDVVISVETAERNARRHRVPLDRELRNLVIHGTLHVVGMDHIRPAERRDMQAVERHLRWLVSAA